MVVSEDQGKAAPGGCGLMASVSMSEPPCPVKNGQSQTWGECICHRSSACGIVLLCRVRRKEAGCAAPGCTFRDKGNEGGRLTKQTWRL